MRRFVQYLITVALALTSTRATFAAPQCRQYFAMHNPPAAAVHPQSQPTSKDTLRFATYNMMKAGGKRQEALAAIAANIREADPDIVNLQEIASEDAALQLVHQYLGGNYQLFFVRGPAGRNINNAVLIHHRLPYQAKLYNVALPTIDGNEALFNRGLPIILLEPLPPSDRPSFAVINLHLKSPINHKGHPLAADLRTLQLDTLIQLLDKIAQRFSSRIILGGDINADIARFREGLVEFAALQERGFHSAFDLVQEPIAVNQRYTQVYIPRKGPPIPQQLDGFLLSGHMMVKDVNIIRSFPDQEQRLRVHHELLNVISDHDMVVMDLEIP